MYKSCYILLLCCATFFSYGQSEFICSSSGIYEVDFSNCTSVQISNIGTFSDIAILPNGELYVIDFYKLYWVDISTGNISFIADIDSIGGGFNSLVALDNTTLLAIKTNSGLYEIDVSTGNTFFVGNLGYYPSGDLTKFREEYFMSDALGQLVKFDYDSDQKLISNITLLGPMNTPSSSVYGVLTTGSLDCSSDNLTLLGFEGLYAYDIDASSGNATFRCDIQAGNITGATSLVETQNQVLTGSVTLPNVFSPNGDGINDKLLPILEDDFIKSYEIKVLNRWGNIVYSDSGEGNFGWDGKTNEHTICNEGVYYCIFSFTDRCNNQRKQTGFVHLIR